MVRSHAIADQATRHRQAFDDVDTTVGQETAELIGKVAT